MARLLLSALLIGWAGQACAQFWRDCVDSRVYVVATVASEHGDRSAGYRERHAGIGVEHVCGDVRGAAGVIPKNSNSDPTLYGGYAWMPLTWRDLRGGLFGGFFTGYSRPLMPAVALVGAWEPRRWLYPYGLNLLGFPPYDGEYEWVFVLQLKRGF